MPTTNTEIGSVASDLDGASASPMMAAVAYTTVVLAPASACAAASRRTLEEDCAERDGMTASAGGNGARACAPARL
ncbi:hypothetical protein DK45_3785 [Bordetella bronchiseptica]|nr:hypothetical protein DK45_3785 [Bordetella bronchiseptica]